MGQGSDVSEKQVLYLITGKKTWGQKNRIKNVRVKAKTLACELKK